MLKFIVLTVDHDEQRIYRDIVEATSHFKALNTVLEHRPYCCYGGAYSAEGLRQIADRSGTSPVDFFEEES
jgi:hypothetical protein